MKTPLLLLISLTALCSATGDEGMETRHLYGEIGSSVFLPGVQIDNNTVFDLSKAKGNLIVTCHGDCKVMEPYTHRGHFYQRNGSFLLTKLVAEDSGTFEYKTNFTLNRRIYLRVMGPVMDSILWKREVMENSSQCLFILTCHAKGDGPFNFTFLRNEKEILHYDYSNNNCSSLTMDGWDPATSGRFSCGAANPISFRTSPTIELQTPATLKQKIMRVIVVGFLCHWTFTTLYLFAKFIYKSLTKPKQKVNGCNCKGNQDFGEFEQDGRKPSQVSKVFTVVGNLFGFLKEIALIVICVLGDFFPVWSSLVPGIFLLCRVIFWTLYFINCSREKRVKFSSDVELTCSWAMSISNMLVIPAFCIALLVIFDIHYGSPCEMMDIWQFVLPVVVIIISVGLCITYLAIKKIVKAKETQLTQSESFQLVNVQTESSHVPNGDIDQLKSNGHPNCEGGVSEVGSCNPKADQETPEQSEAFNEEGSEDHMIPKPDEGQPKVPEEVPFKNQMKAALAPNHESSDGTENREEQRLLTLETKGEAHDKDHIANG